MEKFGFISTLEFLECIYGTINKRKKVNLSNLVSQSTLNKMPNLKILEITDKKTCLLAKHITIYYWLISLS